MNRHARVLKSYEKNAAEAATRQIANARALGTAITISPLVLFCELPELTPVWVGTGVRVEVKREEDDDDMLLLSESVEELEGREELPEGREDPGVVLLSPASVPVPQGILSPFG